MTKMFHFPFTAEDASAVVADANAAVLEGSTVYVRTHAVVMPIAKYKGRADAPTLVARGTGAQLTNVRRPVYLTSDLLRDIARQLGYVQEPLDDTNPYEVN